MNATIELPNDLPSAHAVINELILKNQELERQLDWFQRQIFGEKSEKIIKELPGSKQLWLGGEAPAQNEAPEAGVTVKEHVRRRNGKKVLEDDCGESGLRFNSSVPVEESTQLPDEVKGLEPESYEIIDTKVTERLCQRSGSYYVKRTLCPLVKIKETGKLSNAPMPVSVFERSYADATLLAGILVDKFQYHLPLYRQHQRMTQAGIMIARANLTHWVHKTAKLFMKRLPMRCVGRTRVVSFLRLKSMSLNAVVKHWIISENSMQKRQKLESCRLIKDLPIELNLKDRWLMRSLIG